MIAVIVFLSSTVCIARNEYLARRREDRFIATLTGKEIKR